MTVETPAKLTKGDLPLPDNVKKVIDQMYVYDYMSEKGFKIMINSIKYKPVIKRANLQGAANGSVNKMKSQKGVTNFNYTQDTISNNGILGFLQKGTVSKILNYHKGLSKETIRKLADYFKVSQEAFNRPYRIKNEANHHFRNASLMNTKKKMEDPIVI